MTSRPVPDDPARHSPGRVGVRADALDAALADLNAIEAQALRWLVRRQDGLDAAAELEFQAWRHAEPTHQAAFDDMENVWRDIDAIPAADVAQLRDRVKPASSAEPLRMPLQHRPPRPAGTSSAHGWPPVASGRTRRAVAACVACVAIFGVGWFAWGQWQQHPVFSQHYATARGQQIETRLPDGSTLRLDSASQASVTLYRQRREVRLPEGQIMFTVQGDASRPFDVLAGAMRITVVGTQFSVRYTPSLGSQQVQVAVERGRVRVARADATTGRDDALQAAPAADAVDLEAGQTIVADAEGRLGAVGRITAAGIAPWRANRVDFDNLPLDAAIAELERYGRTGLLVRDPAVAALRVTGSVDLRRVGDFARSLPQVLPVRLTPREDATEVVFRRP